MNRPQPFEFQPGDVLACWGDDRVSRVIQWGTYLTTGPWFPPRLPPSHVGIIARIRGQCLLVESTTLCERPCLVTGKMQDGVAAHEPMTRIGDYAGRVEVWRLVPMFALSTAEQILLSLLIQDHYLGERHCGYDRLRATVSGTVICRWFTHPEPAAAFCSEFVYACLMRFARLNVDNPARYNPAALIEELRKTGVARREVSHWIGGQPYLDEESVW